MQDDDAGHLRNELAHVVVERRIPHLIDDAVERAEIGQQPRRILDGERGPDAVDGDPLLIDHQRHVVMGRERRKKIGAVIGNARLLGRKRRDEREPPTRGRAGDRPRQSVDRCALDGGKCADRGIIPGELSRAFAPVVAQALAERRVRQRLCEQSSNVGLAFRIEQGGIEPDDFRNAGGIRGDRGRAAGHGLKHRQSETLAQRRRNEGGAKIVKAGQYVVVHRAREDARVRVKASLPGGFLEHTPFAVGDAAGENELVLASRFDREQSKGANCTRDVLARIEASDVENERPANSMA